jgi:hypothetical protein
MGGERAEMVFTDPPYNVPIAGHVLGRGSAKHGEFAMASGEMSEAEFTTFLTQVFQLLAANSLAGSLHFVCMDWRHLFELLTAGPARLQRAEEFVCVDQNKRRDGIALSQPT